MKGKSKKGFWFYEEIVGIFQSKFYVPVIEKLVLFLLV